ncbi:unnamed protein product [Mytilus coruscus]|uniref:Uncharacterized protein n=1 Tax=Mytilus coruscus TaxID=42192 RepID=A0A6J8E537_MYTCO|nr:unnamed protein product [Mytilus coruscus]
MFEVVLTYDEACRDYLLRLDDDELALERESKGQAKGKYSKTIGKSNTVVQRSTTMTLKERPLQNKDHKLSSSTSYSNTYVIINMISEMRNDQSSANKRLEDINKRIDVLYSNDCYDEEYDNEGEVDEDVEEVHEANDGHDTGTNEPPCKQ